MFDVMKLTMPIDEYNLIKNTCVRDMSGRRGAAQVVHSAGFAKNPPLEVRSPRIIMSVLGMSRPKSMGLDLMKEWGLVDIPIFVQQMTLIEYEHFSAVQPDEFLKQSWSAASREALAPHLSCLVKRFNEMGYWVATQILTAPTTKQQSKIMRRYIKIAYRLHEIHNYNSMMQILSGLQNLSVVRLKQAWKGVKNSAKHKFEDMVAAMSGANNFQKYRESIERCYGKKPAIPYLVVYMRDLTFAEEISDKTEQGAQNFAKLMRIGKQLQWFKQFAERPYDFQMDMSVQKILQELKVITEEELYQLSLVCEPRSPSGEEIVSPRAPRKSLNLDFLRGHFHTSR